MRSTMSAIQTLSSICNNLMSMLVLADDRCVGDGEQEVLAVVTDPTLSLDGDQDCLQWHPDVHHEVGIVQVKTR